MRSKNNKTELLNPEEGEDSMGDAIGEELLALAAFAQPSILFIPLVLHHGGV